MSHRMQIIGLRIVHGLFTVYFIACIVYIYYAAWQDFFDTLIVAALISLFLEAVVVFLCNKGDCPSIHIQKRIGDDTPFFALFMPAKLAKLAIPIFSVITIIGLVFLIFRSVIVL